FNPREASEILFQHPEKGLVGVARPPKESGGAVTVRLGSGATLTGRPGDAGGKPRGGGELGGTVRPPGGRGWVEESAEPVRTGRAGSASRRCCPTATSACPTGRASCSPSARRARARRRTWVTWR